ncbi:uncharacterized protein [Physcomitrium patens]|uniref:uncharacterized protein isoform X2 n=1 Tax=Physcomitrium patens TaxID=3218 RepID=UPI003CCCC101
MQRGLFQMIKLIVCSDLDQVQSCWGNEDHRTFLEAELNQSSYFGKFQNPSPGVTRSKHYRLFNQCLQLTFEDDRLRSTSPVSTSGRVAAPLQQDRDDEIEQLLKIQVIIPQSQSCCTPPSSATYNNFGLWIRAVDKLTHMERQIHFVH